MASTDHERVALALRPGQSLLDARAHARVDDGFEIAQGGLVLEDDRTEGSPVEHPRGVEDAIAEAVADRAQRGLPGSGHLTREGIGVDDGATELTQHAGHGRLAAADGTGEADDDRAAPLPGRLPAFVVAHGARSSRMSHASSAWLRA